MLAAGACLGLAGCLDLELVANVVFPPTIAGLDPGQPWIPMPVGSWVTEGRIEAAAIAGCFTCAPAAAVGLFRASGPAGQELMRIAARPETVRAMLQRGPDRKVDPRKPTPAVTARAEPIREKGWTGFAINLSRDDGSRQAAGVALVRGERGRATVLLVVAESTDAAERIAREVVGRQS